MAAMTAAEDEAACSAAAALPVDAAVDPFSAVAVVVVVVEMEWQPRRSSAHCAHETACEERWHR